MTYEIKAICGCETQSNDDELYALTPEIRGYAEVPVIILRDGTVTNRYADGVAGVIKRIYEAAKADDEPYCPECENYIERWEHNTAQ